MLLEDKIAIVYGGGGAVGRACALAFAAEGARVFLAGRSRQKLDDTAAAIAAAGGSAEVAVVDCLDGVAVDQHASRVVASAGRVDIALNAVGIAHDQGTPFGELSFEVFNAPVAGYMQCLFATAKAVSRHMVRQRSGVFLTLSTPGAKLPGPGFMGNGVASAAVEAFTRHLAGELGASGVRAICLRPHAVPQALAAGSHSQNVFAAIAARQAVSVDQMLEGMAAGTLLKRLPTLDQVSAVAAFMASERAAAMTGTVANLTCGLLVD